MKRFSKCIACYLIVFALLVSVVSPVWAYSEESHGLSIGLNAFFELGEHDDLLSWKDAGHLTFVENMRESKVGTLAMKVLGLIFETGSEPDEAKYMEVLVNIMKTYEMENASAISDQYKMDNLKAMDNLKGIEDYTMDVLEIGIGLIPSVKGADNLTEQLAEWLKIAASGLQTLGSNTNDWIKGISNLETIIQNYTRHDSFLALIQSEATGNLKSAATKLRTAMTESMKIKLETYSDISSDNIDSYTSFFFEDAFFQALKLTDLYEKDSAFQGFVNASGNVIQLWSALHLGYKIGKFVGSIAIGAPDIVNRTLEMKAIYDITKVLESGLNSIERNFPNVYTNSSDINAEEYVLLGNYLISCRVRGEYCLYSMLAKDSGLYSKLGDENAIAAEKQYNRLTVRMAGLKEKLSSIENVLIVEMPNEPLYEIVNSTSVWNVYDVNGSLYDNYTLRIYDKQNLLEMVLFGEAEEIDHAVVEHNVTKAEPLQLSLEAGYAYTFEFIDNSNPEESIKKTVGVMSESDLIYIVDVDTEFGKTADQFAEAAYRDILDMFYTSISCNWNNCDGLGWDDVYDPDNACYLFRLYSSDCSLSEIGYALLDLDKNGQPELFIAPLSSTEPGEFYDLYTISSGEIIHVVSAGERDRYWVAENNSINNRGSGGAAFSIFENTYLDSSEGKLRINQAIIYDGWKDSDNPYFYATTDYYNEKAYEINYDVLTSISNDEAAALQDDFPENIPLDLIPFDEYVSAELNKSEETSGAFLPSDDLQAADPVIRQAYITFLTEKTYESELRNNSTWYDYWGAPEEYAVMDLDGDYIPELLLRVDLGDGWEGEAIFAYQQGSGVASYVGTLYSYCGLSYVPAMHSIRYLFPRPTISEVYIQFCTIRNGALEDTQCLCHVDSSRYILYPDGSKGNMPETEFDSIENQVVVRKEGDSYRVVGTDGRENIVAESELASYTQARWVPSYEPLP